MNWRHVVPVLAAAVCRYGCTPAAAVAGSASAVMVAQDPRSVGAQIENQAIDRRAGSAIAGEARASQAARSVAA